MLREAEGGWCLPVIAKVDCHKRLWDERIMLRFLIAALAVFAHAPESEAKSPKLAIRLIAALEKRSEAAELGIQVQEMRAHLHGGDNQRGLCRSRGDRCTRRRHRLPEWC